MLLLLFIFIFMLIGMELFAYKVMFDDDDMPISFDSEGRNTSVGHSPRANFNYPARALTTIFIVAVGDDWNAIMYSYYRAFHISSKVSAYLVVLFFIIMFVFMNMLLLNLFLAILLETYGDKPKDDDLIAEDNDEEAEEDIGPVYIAL